MYKLCLEKLRDFNLIKEQNFIWCANVSICKVGSKKAYAKVQQDAYWDTMAGRPSCEC